MALSRRWRLCRLLRRDKGAIDARDVNSLLSSVSLVILRGGTCNDNWDSSFEEADNEVNRANAVAKTVIWTSSA